MFKIQQKLISSVLVKTLSNRHMRKFILKTSSKAVYRWIVNKQPDSSKPIQQKKYEILNAMLNMILKNLDRGYISEDVFKKLVNSLIKGALEGKKDTKKSKEQFKERHGQNPPDFIVISPTQVCNLNCSGCYAASGVKTLATLPYDVVEKVVDESYNSFGNRFLVISGGEPFMYRDKKTGKTLFDIWEKFNDMFFMVYTNGTCITKGVAERLAKLGNVTPAISIEGYEAETDERRGKNTYKNILKAFENLREVGVPFGISVTATKKNVDILLNDEFYEFYFDKQGATYMWQFQLMPIGRAKDTKELMVTPEQRVKMYHKWKEVLIKKKYFVADFWNSGVVANGCIAYAREGGYLYVDWNGNITPCVFIPYYVDNILDLYKEGKKLEDAIFSDFFKNGRAWQEEYGLGNRKRPCNLLMPCSMRDHYKNFRENIMTKDVKPEDKNAEEALESKEYFNTLHKFDQELEALTKPIWQEEYVEK